MPDDDKVSMARMGVASELPVFVCDLKPMAAQLQLARQALDELRISHPASTPSNVQAVYMSPWKSHRLHPLLQPLCQGATLIVEACARSIGQTGLADLNLELVITDCWGAIYEQADHTRRHNHFPADFAAVVYLEAAEGCAPLVFAGRTAVQPRAGSMLVFPGILDHEVPPTAGRRVVVAMNLHKKATFVPGMVAAGPA